MKLVIPVDGWCPHCIMPAELTWLRTWECPRCGCQYVAAYTRWGDLAAYARVYLWTVHPVLPRRRV